MSVLAPYEVPNLVIEGNDVLVNKPKVCAYRAPGAPQSMHAMECAIDELARKLDMDHPSLRLKNAAGEGTVAPYGPRFPAIGLRACLEAAKEHPNYKAPVPEGAGRGLAVIQACERPIASLLAQPIRLPSSDGRPSLPLRSPAPRRGYYIAQGVR